VNGQTVLYSNPLILIFILLDYCDYIGYTYKQIKRQRSKRRGGKQQKNINIYTRIHVKEQNDKLKKKPTYILVKGIQARIILITIIHKEKN
jgi:hypothetical protein